MASPPRVIITGAPNPWPEGSTPPKRLNIVDFVKDERMFSLYIQALQEMYRAGDEDICSYYQVGGIHGLPYTPWNDDPNKTPVGTFGGYCSHESTTFPTWHRPYVLAFEQILQSHATRIAEEYTTESAEWRQTAAILRQPFWDWAAPGQAVPPDEVIRLKKVVIRAKPDGKHTEVENPLYTYKFKSKIPGSTAPFDQWMTTLRYPKDNQSDPEALARTLLQNQEGLTIQTFFMFVLLDQWPEFSNTRAHVQGSPATSLEGIHNSIHNWTGGGGHMSEVSVAGFDPIFYMHHANVDRCLSLWAALHPGVWVTEDQEVDGTFDLPDGATVNGLTPLLPFPDSVDTYWTSNGSVDTTHMGYIYPEFEGLNMSDPIDVKRRIKEIVGKLYSYSYLAPLSLELQPAALADATSTTTATSPGIPTSFWEWSARVRVKQSELERSFQVLIFLGSVPEDPSEWDRAQSYVGSFSAFVNGAAARCANCQAQLDTITEGYVHLENAIAKHGIGIPFDLDSVKEYLTDSLNWRIQMADGTPVPLERLPSLEVTVAALEVMIPFGEVLPVPVGKRVLHRDITSRRPGGARLA